MSTSDEELKNKAHRLVCDRKIIQKEKETAEKQLERKSFQDLKSVWDHSKSHKRTYITLLAIFQTIIWEADNPAWEILHQFILDPSLPVSGRNNAVWIVLGLIGHLQGNRFHNELVNDCIYMLLKNMTNGLEPDQVTLNVSYYDQLEFDSVVKLPGMGLFIILQLNMPLLWPICCRQLQRWINEDGGLLATVKLLIGLFEFRHSGDFTLESNQECHVLVDIIIKRTGENTTLNLRQCVNLIREAYRREGYFRDEGYCSDGMR